MMSMLIIQACGAEGEKEECKMVQTQAEAYGLSTRLIMPKTKEELEEGLESGEPYDFIYVSSHGDEASLCNRDNSLQLDWLEFGLMLCESGAIGDNSIIMLSCCRGGLNQVAYALFHSCPGIRYVVGPRAKLDAFQMQICYSILLYLLVQQDKDPVVACEKIKSATDIRFYFSDRLETETEYGYIETSNMNAERLKELQKERGWTVDELLNGKEQVVQPDGHKEG